MTNLAINGVGWGGGEGSGCSSYTYRAETRYGEMFSRTDPLLSLFLPLSLYPLILSIFPPLIFLFLLFLSSYDYLLLREIVVWFGMFFFYGAVKMTTLKGRGGQGGVQVQITPRTKQIISVGRVRSEVRMSIWFNRRTYPPYITARHRFAGLIGVRRGDS